MTMPLKGLVAGGLLLTLAACSDSAERSNIVRLDGSSTVFPITEAVAERFQNENRGRYRVTVGVSGTGGGFKKFCRGETDLSNASRPIRESEIKLCEQNGVEFIELPIALDALTVVVNPENDWVDYLTVEELKTIWEPEAQNEITSWAQVREGFPDRSLSLFGAGADSGTYDYFTQAIVGEEHASRGDYTASEDDNVLVMGVANDVAAMGFFGFAYYSENRDKLKAVAISYKGGEPVLPTIETARNASYQPLSRPLFMYVSKAAADESPGVRALMDIYLDPEVVSDFVREVGYVPLPDEAYRLAKQVLEARRTGTAFEAGSEVGVSIDDLLRLEQTAS